MMWSSTSHKHCWTEAGRFYAPPVNSEMLRLVVDEDEISEDTVERLSLGITTILYRCDVCLDSYKEIVLGRQVDAPVT